MEALIAVGLAGNVVQFVTCAGSLASQVNHIRKHDSPESLPVLLHLSRTLTDQAVLLTNRLKSSAATLTEEDQNLLNLCIECEETGHTFIEYLETWEPKSISILQCAKKALKFHWKSHQIEGFSQKIDKLRTSLALAAILALRSSAECNHEDLLKHLQELRIDVNSHQTISLNDRIQPTIAEISDAVRYHTFDRLKDIQDGISACTEQIQRIRDEQAKDTERRRTPDSAEAVLHWLDFRQINWRFDAVNPAHQKTFSWIFNRTQDHTSWDSFVNHLEEDASQLYFINGKAGSGKSTLMKFIVNDPRTKAALHRWAGSTEVVILPYFFWNVGSDLQKSHVGLLRALLHTVLVSHPELVPAVFPRLYHNWKNSEAHLAPEYVELKTALQLLTQKARYLKFVIIIDGIDEFEGIHHDMSVFLRGLVSSRTKLVVSSRPINACLHAFSGCPTLRLQELTQPDMDAFVRSELSNHQLMVSLSRQFPEQAPLLAAQIVERSAGVFLWVSLVTRHLIEGLEDGDNLNELQERLRSLPPDLGDLYRRMLSKLSPKYQEQASEILQIIQLWNTRVPARQLPCLILSHALNDPEDCFNVSDGPISRRRFDFVIESLGRRIRSRCCGLLEVHHVPPQSSNTASGQDLISWTNIHESVVSYLHRSVEEFLATGDVWAHVVSFTDHCTFDASRQLMSGCLSTLKTGQDIDHMDLESYLSYTAKFLRSAKHATNQSSLRFLLEIDKKMDELNSKRKLTTCELDKRACKSDSNRNLNDTKQEFYRAHWWAYINSRGLGRDLEEGVSLETFAADQALYFFPISTGCQRSASHWSYLIQHCLQAPILRRPDMSTEEWMRTLTYLTKQCSHYDDVQLEAIWRCGIKTSCQLVRKAAYEEDIRKSIRVEAAFSKPPGVFLIEAAEIIRVLLGMQPTSHTIWLWFPQLQLPLEENPTKLLQKLTSFTEATFRVEPELRMKLSRTLECIKLLVERPDPTEQETEKSSDPAKVERDRTGKRSADSEEEWSCSAGSDNEFAHDCLLDRKLSQSEAERRKKRSRLEKKTVSREMDSSNGHVGLCLS